MINRICGLKQHAMQVNGHAWFNLHGAPPSCEEGAASEKFKLRTSVLFQWFSISVIWKHIKMDREYYGRTCRIVIDLYPTICRDCLQKQLPPSLCRTAAANIRTLRPVQTAVINNVSNCGHYGQCYMPLMYILASSACGSLPPPSAGLGKSPITGSGLGMTSNAWCRCAKPFWGWCPRKLWLWWITDALWTWRGKYVFDLTPFIIRTLQDLVWVHMYNYLKLPKSDRWIKQRKTRI